LHPKKNWLPRMVNGDRGRWGGEGKPTVEREKLGLVMPKEKVTIRGTTLLEWKKRGRVQLLRGGEKRKRELERVEPFPSPDPKGSAAKKAKFTQRIKRRETPWSSKREEGTALEKGGLT